MKILSIAQIIVSIMLIVTILLQNRGAGLSAAFAGEMGGYYTKRGLEKFLFYASIILAFVFLTLSAVRVFLFN